MAYKLSGSVLLVGDTTPLQSRSGVTFTKRDLVITVRKFDPYTGVPTEEPGNTPKITFLNSNCQQLDGVKVGDIVTVHFDISGRSYDKDGRREYSTDIRGFRVEVQRIGQPQNVASNAVHAPTQPTDVLNAPQAAPTAAQVQTDDLPF